MKMTVDELTGDTVLNADPIAASVPDVGHFENLAKSVISSTHLDGLCSSLQQLISGDDSSRDDWRAIVKEAYTLLGIGPESKKDNDEDPQSDTSDHPLLLTSLQRFQARALAAMLPSGSNAVRTESVIDPKSIEDDAAREEFESKIASIQRRVEDYYSYYLFEKLESYEADTDQILFDSGIQGAGYRKIVTDKTRKSRPVNLIHVPAADLIISYDAKSLRSGRITHRINLSTTDLIRYIMTGQYVVKMSLTPEEPEGNVVTEAIDRMVGLSSDADKSTATHRILECHCDLIVEEDRHPLGLARPYIVTIHATSNEILSVVRNWRENDPDEERIKFFVPYPYSPGKTPTSPLGLGHILSNTTRALRKAQRAGLVAGYLQNHPSGFKLSSFKIRDDSTKIRAGEFVDIDSPTDDIRRALMMHPFAGPSPGLQTLADKIELNGKELSGVASVDFVELMKSGITAGAVAAAIEESSVFQTAIHRRLYNAMTEEMALLHERMKEMIGNELVMFGDNGQLLPGDLISVKLLPVMTPGSSSKQRDVLEAQAVYDMSKEVPDVINPRTAAVNYLRSLANPSLEDAILPPPDKNPPVPSDVVTEYGMILQGKPVAAGLMQNHAAHISAHSSQMKGLQASQLPPDKAMAAMATLADHIADHMAKDAVVQVCATVGIDPAMFEKGIPPQMENQIAPQMAQAVGQIEEKRMADLGVPDPVALQQAKDEGAKALEQLKADHAKELEQIKATNALALQKAKDDAAMEREEADDETALEIAGLQRTLKSNANADARASAGAGSSAEASAGSGGVL